MSPDIYPYPDRHKTRNLEFEYIAEVWSEHLKGLHNLYSNIPCIVFFYENQRSKITTFNLEIPVTMANKFTGSHVIFYEKFVIFYLKIRKLTVKTINIDLMENLCIDELFSIPFWHTFIQKFKQLPEYETNLRLIYVLSKIYEI